MVEVVKEIGAAAAVETGATVAAGAAAAVVDFGAPKTTADAVVVVAAAGAEVELGSDPKAGKPEVGATAAVAVVGFKPMEIPKRNETSHLLFLIDTKQASKNELNKPIHEHKDSQPEVFIGIQGISPKAISFHK